MGKRQIAAQETRRKIIAAAEKLIREKGFEAVGVSDIAKEAGVARAHSIPTSSARRMWWRKSPTTNSCPWRSGPNRPETSASRSHPF